MVRVEDLQAQITALEAANAAAEEDATRRIAEADKEVEEAKKKEKEAQKKIDELRAKDPGNAQIGEAIASAIIGINSKRDAEKHKPTYKGRWGWDKKKVTLPDGTSKNTYPERKTSPIPAGTSIKAFPSSIAKAPTDVVGQMAINRILIPLSCLSGGYIIGGALHGIHGRLFLNTSKAQSADEATLRFWLEKDEHLDIFSWRQACYLMRALIDFNTENFPELAKRYWTHVTEVDMRATVAAWPVYLLYDCLVRNQASASLANGEFPESLGVWDADLFDTARARFGASLDDVAQKVVPDAWSKIVALSEKAWPEVRDELIVLETKIVKGQVVLHPPSLAVLKVAGSIVPSEVACPSTCRAIAPIPSSASNSGSARSLGTTNQQQRNSGNSSSNQGGNGGNRGTTGKNNGRTGGGGAHEQPFRPRLCVGCGKQGHSIGGCNSLFPRLERVPSTSNTGAVTYRVHSKEGEKLPVCLAYNINDHHRDNCGCEDLCSKCGGKHPLVAHQGLGLADFAILNLQ